MSATATGYQPARSPAATLGVVGVHLALGALALTGLRVATLPASPPPPMVARTLDPAQPPPVPEPTPMLERIEATIPRPDVEVVPDVHPDPGITAVHADDGPPTTGPANDDVGTRVTPRADPPPTIAATDARLDVRYAARFQPPYPDTSTRLGEEGTVVVRVRIGFDGLVIDASVAESSGHPRLDAAALARARSAWRFIPATRDGRPVEAVRTVPVRFHLNP